MSFKGGGRTEKKEEEEEEKFALCESIGHRPLRGRCPKGDRPTDQRTVGGLIFSHFLSDSKRGFLSVRRMVLRKVRYTRFWMIRNWPKQRFLSIIAPAHSIYCPWPSAWLPLPILILTLPTRKQLPNGCVPSIGKTKIFYMTVEFDFIVACTRIYTPLSPSIRRLVGRSVCRSITLLLYLSILFPSVILSHFKVY